MLISYFRFLNPGNVFLKKKKLKSVIQNLIKDLRWSELQKQLTA